MKEAVIELVLRASNDVNNALKKGDLHDLYKQRMYLLGVLHGAAWATDDQDFRILLRNAAECVVNTVAEDEIRIMSFFA